MSMDDTHITSVETAQEISLPSNVDPPEPSPREAIIHIGASNRLDPQIYQQNIHRTTLTWSTNDQPGTLLWWAALTPRDINPIVSHMADCYHVWTGDAVYEVKIAGTSFHAGMLTVVELPPNVHPNDLAGTRDYSAYNWKGIDAKNPTLEGFSVRDVRQTTFHYVDDEQNIGNHHHGGYIAIYVDMALNTSSTGTQQISVQVWSKPAPNFRLLKLKIPRLRSQVRSSFLEEYMNYMLDFTKGDELVSIANLQRQASYLVVMPKSKVTFNEGKMNCFDADGKPISKITGVPDVHSFESRSPFEVVWHDKKPSGTNDADVRYQAHFEAGWRMDKINDAGHFLVEKLGMAFTIKRQYPQNPEKGKRFEPMFVIEADQMAKGSMDALIAMSSIKGYYIVGADVTDFWSEPESELITNNESAIRFMGTKNESLVGYMTDEMASAFSKRIYSGWFPAGQAATFIMSSDNVPVGKAKLYRSGRLTTAGSKDQVKYDINKMRFNFDGFISESQPLGATKEMSYNRYLVLPHHSSYSTSR
ncbi:capsid protein [Wabat virus]|uniref:capsid protein n=1 Tax=Wabat virus TaxID=1888308 RepID=UPI00083EFD4C|nr:capsid protein [Wabat virus]AOC55052.1 capsid protein [Wabat virus]